jgi:hypothetical protein
VEDKREYSGPALVAAFLLGLAMLMASVAVVMDRPMSLGLAGIVGLAGIGWSILALRDDE